MASKKAKAKAKPAKKKAQPAKAAKKPAKVVKAAKKPLKAPKPAKPAPKKVILPKVAAKVEKKILKPDKPLKGKLVPIVSAPMVSAPSRNADGWLGPLPDKPLPRRTKLPSEDEQLTKREMEQVLTVGTRGVMGEGSLKGLLVVYQGFPYLEVMGRDKRELWFLLQGPDQEVLPAYADHKVSVTGLIRRNSNYGGFVDVRKYSAKKPEEPAEIVEPVPEVAKLRLLSPGEVETLSTPGMAVGVRGFATLRGKLEQSGDDYYLVVSNSGTRQQVGFSLMGKGAKGLRKFVGEIIVATGVVEKATAWGGTIQTESAEARAPEFPPVARSGIEVAQVDGGGAPKEVEAKLNHGLSVRLSERQGYTWAIEPQTAKRISLREVNIDQSGGGLTREFFFTPRNPGLHEVEFFLGKVHNPMQVTKTFKLAVNVKQPVEVA